MMKVRSGWLGRLPADADGREVNGSECEPARTALGDCAGVQRQRDSALAEHAAEPVDDLLVLHVLATHGC